MAGGERESAPLIRLRHLLPTARGEGLEFGHSDGVVYRVSGTETVAGGRARRRATPGQGVRSRVAPRQWCGELSTKRADQPVMHVHRAAALHPTEKLKALQ